MDLFEKQGLHLKTQNKSQSDDPSVPGVTILKMFSLYFVYC